MSRGLRQRVGIARTLVNDPPIILLDEPSAGLDPEARNDLQNLFKDLGAQGKTLIVSSHILTELEDYCTHVALLNKGRLASFGEIGALRKAQGSSRRILIEIIAGAETATTVLTRLGVIDLKKAKNTFTFAISGDETAQADLLSELISAGVRLTQFTEESGRIQEAYLTHMKGTRE